jgi:hypothetical protein
MWHYCKDENSQCFTRHTFECIIDQVLQLLNGHTLQRAYDQTFLVSDNQFFGGSANQFSERCNNQSFQELCVSQFLQRMSNQSF